MRSSDFNPVLDPDPATMATPIDIAATNSVRFLSKSSIECSTRTVPMSDIVDVGLICNRMAHTVVFGLIALAMQSGSVK